MTESFRVTHGDCREVMKTMEAGSFDSVVCDPPYHLTQISRAGSPRNNDSKTPYGRTRIGERGFMGKTWDGGDVAHDPAVWRQCLRLLRPGGYLVAFGGSRTYHRLACAIEDVGFEIRDQIQWIYGSGFPKSLNIGNGFGTALKPAHEPIVLARKPLIGTVAENVLQHGTGGLNIDGCRINPGEIVGGGGNGRATVPNGFGSGETKEHGSRPRVEPHDLGRWPANVIHDGSEEVLAAFPDAPGQQGDLSGHSKDRLSKGIFGDMKSARDAVARLDSGSAARFFYCAKATQDDRDEGCEDLPHRVADDVHKRPRTELDDPRRHGVTPRQNNHPTVKPTELMRYLCRLVTPPRGLVLDPFCGSGSTGKAAVLEGLRFVGIELSADYCEIARRRIEAATKQGLLFL